MRSGDDEAGSTTSVPATMILSDRTIKEQIAAGRIVIEPLDERDVQPSSVDLHIDRYFRVFRNHTMRVIDVKEDQEDLTELVEVSEDDPFILHPGEFVLGSTLERVQLPDDLVARLEGKALALTTEVPTPAGWRTMAELVPGDEVFHPSGAPVLVVAVSAHMVGRPCFEVTFSDHTSIVADADHQWVTTTKSRRSRRLPARIVTTAAMAETVRVGRQHNHQIALCGEVNYPRSCLPIDPYVLGLWLGGGMSRAAEVTSADPELDLWGNTYVPEAYLVACAPDRIALLQGLMDSDGHVDEFGRCEFVSVTEGVADAVVELAASLGLCPVKGKKRAMLRGVDCGPAYRVRFTPHFPVFRLPRKVVRQKPLTARPIRFRAVTSVRRCESVPVRCIQVAASDGMFLVGRTFIPTHNSSLGRLGLLIHSTAGFVDAGWDGQLTLELSNVANLPITLYPGMKIGQISFLQMTTAAEHPYGTGAVGSKYQHQVGPRPSRFFENFRPR